MEAELENRVEEEIVDSAAGEVEADANKASVGADEANVDSDNDEMENVVKELQVLSQALAELRQEVKNLLVDGFAAIKSLDVEAVSKLITASLIDALPKQAEATEPVTDEKFVADVVSKVLEGIEAMRTERKSTVVTEIVADEDPQVNLKNLSTSDLAKYIAKSAIVVSQ